MVVVRSHTTRNVVGEASTAGVVGERTPNEERAMQCRSRSDSRRKNRNGRQLVEEAQLEDRRQGHSLKDDEAGVKEVVEELSRTEEHSEVAGCFLK